MKREPEFYLLLLAYALVEIRAVGSEGEVSSAQAIADTFHHIPEALRLDWTVDREQRIRQQLRTKARVHGLSELLARWESRAKRRLEAGR